MNKKGFVGWTMDKEGLIEIEERIKCLFLDKKIRYPVHFSVGSEEKVLEIFREIGEGDWVFGTHRNHYQAIMKGIDLEGWIPKYGSMHIYGEKFFTSGIVGGVLPIALGVALANKRRNSSSRVWVFVGDMAATTGIFHECFLYASGHDLPITFVIEDNGYSVNTPVSEVWGKSGTMADCRHYKYERKYPHQGCGTYVIF